MKIERLLVAGICILCVCLLTHCSKFDHQNPDPPLADDPTAEEPQFVPSPDLQHDVIARQAGADDIQPSMDVLSWTTFIALNWPVSPLENGGPDRSNIIGGQPGTPEQPFMPRGPVVWESFKEVNDIFLNPPVKPSGFNAKQPIPPSCRQIFGDGDRFKSLSMTSKFSQQVQSSLEAFSEKPVIDQNGNPVWYEVRLNERAFQFIVDSAYYNSNNQPPVIDSYPAGNNLTSEVGAIRVKAAWKIMAAKDDTSRFYTSTAFLIDTTQHPNTCDTVLMGLVGLHMVHKSKSRPQWIWSTFEHVDNAPDSTERMDTSRHWSFYNPLCDTCPINTPPVNAQDRRPTQVLRVTAIDSEVQQLNASFQQAMRQNNFNNVWQYYMLVDTQWPAGPRQTKKLGDPRPPFMANTVIETYFQGPTLNKKTPHSCIGCHGLYAKNKDFGFQLYNAYPRTTKLDLAGLTAANE